MTHLPPFRTRQPLPPSAEADDFDDELPLLGEESILERGAAPSLASDANDPPWDTDVDVPLVDAALREPVPAVTADLPEDEDEDATDRRDVVQAAALAGAWAAQYEATNRAGARYAGDTVDALNAPAPVLSDVLTDVLADGPAMPVTEQLPPSWPASEAVEAHDLDEERDVPTLTTQIEDDAHTDTGLQAADEALAERIADSVMAALQPGLRDTVLDAVRDTLAAARRRD